MSIKRAKNPELALTARRLLNEAVRLGLIIRPECCETCGRTGRIEGHHKDYKFPLKVVWLCRFCHQEQHYPDARQNRLNRLLEALEGLHRKAPK